MYGVCFVFKNALENIKREIHNRENTQSQECTDILLINIMCNILRTRIF